MELTITLKNTSSSPKYQGWRVLHRSEGGRVTPIGMPCVNPALNVAGIIFTASMQWLSYNLASSQNPKVTKDKWRVVYDGGTAFTNQNGWDMKDKPQRRDYVNGRDLDLEFPKLMRAIICSGNFFTGQPVTVNKEQYIQMTPGIDAIDGTKPLPSVSEVIEKGWRFVATTATYVNGVWRVSNFPQGGGGKVWIPYILTKPALYPARWFQRWESDTLPEPTKVYLTP